jgi:hypothetical protein
VLLSPRIAPACVRLPPHKHHVLDWRKSHDPSRRSVIARSVFDAHARKGLCVQKHPTHKTHLSNMTGDKQQTPPCTHAHNFTQYSVVLASPGSFVCLHKRERGPLPVGQAVRPAQLFFSFTPPRSTAFVIVARGVVLNFRKRDSSIFGVVVFRLFLGTSCLLLLLWP